MRIAVFSTQSYDREYLQRFNPGFVLDFFEVALEPHTVGLAAGAGVVCVFVNDNLNAAVINALRDMGVRLIALRCAGFNQVDLAAALAAGIPVVRVPAYSPYAVAEHAVALILTLNRKTHKAFNRVREGNFSLDRLTGFDLHGKTVGVVGTGKIGQAFCHIMLGFGCRVLAFDLVADRDLEAAGVVYASLMEVLESTEIVSLHCPLNAQTRHIINSGSLARMKKGAMLINTSRGGLVETAAVIESLKNGHLGYLGLDVYEQEEKLFFADHSEKLIDDEQILRLISFPNVIITAHQGFFTDEALTAIAKTTMENIRCFTAEEPLLNRV
ncbi:2-hydroxyacid dehydrogenase [Flavihumibacter petaseus]|uniref:D-lactate dehydrogenase n=1 Tax=Flavihumibacter petaseus NBRC 106054 TaxID=1220578 RepID=A0A0E9MXS1_9BACT|nr:2-hydroxyacid dehydrogenase [Flavihumibacter petaseus]GAO42384.1 D-lactate dehydrogenase [Flavihumibacter petaseus NBRC 106054]